MTLAEAEATVEEASIAVEESIEEGVREGDIEEDAVVKVETQTKEMRRHLEHSHLKTSSSTMRTLARKSHALPIVKTEETVDRATRALMKLSTTKVDKAILTS